MNNQGRSEGSNEKHANTHDVEEQSPTRPVNYAPNSELRATIETRVQIALERQRTGQPLTFEDVMALDYEDALRHLRLQQQNQSQNDQKQEEDNKNNNNSNNNN
ncbi:uncharacterized protein [Cicer arietinum]|uniref:Protein ecdysoneless homolog isoform X2 n=1 Tax=Cicer arietinum TaxID=3827 RepID=A0A3Q7XVJ7_CICAR|nr:protein ecdysoneless homolog isoform X2 [Cicer arietinum]